MYQWLVFLHVLSAFGFILGHGASTAIAFRLKKERQLERIHALLDVSTALLVFSWLSFLLMFLAGIVLAFMGRWWRSGWIWTSLTLLIVMVLVMSWATGRHYHALRQVTGLPYMDGRHERGAEPPGSPAEIQAVIDLGRPWFLAIVGLGGWIVILWLMMFKPF